MQHDIRVKIARGGKVKPSEMTSVALRPTVHVTKGSLSNTEFNLLKQWVELNQEVLIQYWNEEMDTGDVLERLKSLPQVGGPKSEAGKMLEEAKEEQPQTREVK